MAKLYGGWREKKSGLPMGVCNTTNGYGKPYQSKICVHLGYFATPEEAHEAFSRARELMPMVKEFLKDRR
jgi:hypothetical protein